MDCIVHIQGKDSPIEKNTYPFSAWTEDIPKEECAGNP